MMNINVEADGVREELARLRESVDRLRRDVLSVVRHPESASPPRVRSADPRANDATRESVDEASRREAAVTALASALEATLRADQPHPPDPPEAPDQQAPESAPVATTGVRFGPPGGVVTALSPGAVSSSFSPVMAGALLLVSSMLKKTPAPAPPVFPFADQTFQPDGASPPPPPMPSVSQLGDIGQVNVLDANLTRAATEVLSSNWATVPMPTEAANLTDDDLLEVLKEFDTEVSSVDPQIAPSSPSPPTQQQQQTQPDDDQTAPPDDTRAPNWSDKTRANVVAVLEAVRKNPLVQYALVEVAKRVQTAHAARQKTQASPDPPTVTGDTAGEIFFDAHEGHEGGENASVESTARAQTLEEAVRAHADVVCEEATPDARARLAEDVTTRIDASLKSEDATARVKDVMERTCKTLELRDALEDAMALRERIARIAKTMV